MKSLSFLKILGIFRTTSTFSRAQIHNEVKEAMYCVILAMHYESLVLIDSLVFSKPSFFKFR